MLCSGNREIIVCSASEVPSQAFTFIAKHQDTRIIQKRIGELVRSYRWWIIVLGMRSATSRCGPLSLWVKEALVVGGGQEDQSMEDRDMEDLRWVRRMGRFLALLGMARAEAQAGASILGRRVKKGCGSRSVLRRTIFWRAIWMRIEPDGVGVEDFSRVQGQSSALNHNILAIPGGQHRFSRCALSHQY